MFVVSGFHVTRRLLLQPHSCRCRSVFRFFDEDRDGYLNYEETCPYLAEHGCACLNLKGAVRAVEGYFHDGGRRALSIDVQSCLPAGTRTEARTELK